MQICPNCQSSLTRWNVGKKGPPDVQDGRLRMSEISVIAYLSCEACGETLKVVDDFEVEEMLNSPAR